MGGTGTFGNAVLRRFLKTEIGESPWWGRIDRFPDEAWFCAGSFKDGKDRIVGDAIVEWQKSSDKWRALNNYNFFDMWTLSKAGKHG